MLQLRSEGQELCVGRGRPWVCVELIQRGRGEEAIRRIVELTRSFLPAILATGVTTEEEVDIDTLADRLCADTGAVGRVTFWPMVVGAFARKPEHRAERL